LVTFPPHSPPGLPTPPLPPVPQAGTTHTVNTRICRDCPTPRTACHAHTRTLPTLHCTVAFCCHTHTPHLPHTLPLATHHTTPHLPTHTLTHYRTRHPPAHHTYTLHAPPLPRYYHGTDAFTTYSPHRFATTHHTYHAHRHGWFAHVLPTPRCIYSLVPTGHLPPTHHTPGRDHTTPYAPCCTTPSFALRLDG